MLTYPSQDMRARDQQFALSKKVYLDSYYNNNRIDRSNSRFSQSPHCATNCLQHVRSRGPGAIVCKSCATHRALITCNRQCATWVRRDSSAIKSDRVEIAFIVMGGGNQSTRRNPPRRRASENATYTPKTQAPSETRTRAVRWWQARKADVLTPRIATRLVFILCVKGTQFRVVFTKTFGREQCLCRCFQR